MDDHHGYPWACFKGQPILDLAYCFLSIVDSAVRFHHIGERGNTGSFLLNYFFTPTQTS